MGDLPPVTCAPTPVMKWSDTETCLFVLENNSGGASWLNISSAVEKLTVISSALVQLD